MRVEQQPHDPKKRRSLAGRGASKFSFIVNRPRALPGSRRVVGPKNGTRRATGRPAFPTRWTRKEKRYFRNLTRLSGLVSSGRTVRLTPGVFGRIFFT